MFFQILLPYYLEININLILTWKQLHKRHIYWKIIQILRKTWKTLNILYRAKSNPKKYIYNINFSHIELNLVPNKINVFDLQKQTNSTLQSKWVQWDIQYWEYFSLNIPYGFFPFAVSFASLALKVFFWFFGWP